MVTCQSSCQHLQQQSGHLIHIGVAEGPRRDAPEVKLMRRACMDTIDRVTAEHDAGAHEEDIVGRFRRQGAQRRWHHRAGVATEHPERIDVPGVTLVPCRGVGREAEIVVVVGDGDDAGPA
jgi:hypothetical protein